MAYSLPFNSSALFKPPHSVNLTHQAFHIKAQRFSDDGGSWTGMVDGNMSVLRERIKEVKTKERLERCCRCENGWNYAAGYNYELKNKLALSQLFHVLGLSCGTFAFTCLTGTLFLCLVSLLVHSNH